MYLWISLIYSKQKKWLSTKYGYRLDEGRVHGTRWEWGVGKGQWKRALKKYAKAEGLTGRTRAIYFVIGSRYTFNYEGTKAATQALYDTF